ncbi:GtrA family protein [Halostella sp. JP-L12]|uniref:GtrA family protein n=1 Tax=Halostella TaxID=1843185 RepID=UPI000EF773DC|nr:MULTISPECIES: GtrA family protein [Halostella]NHN47402.1 GtrA family protein [Halostella sp. JP-L12]
MSDRSVLDGLRLRLRALVSGVRFGQFASVGALGAVIDNAVLGGLLHAGVAPEPAKLAGAEAAIVVMFLINEHWTFADQGTTGVVPFLRRLLTSNLVRAGGVLVATVVFSVVYRSFDVSIAVAGVDFWFLAANLTGIGVGLVVNYVAESLFTWRVAGER